jgi:hypothetical protein
MPTTTTKPQKIILQILIGKQKNNAIKSNITSDEI